MSEAAATPLPGSGSTTQTTAGNSGALGFIDGGGGTGWSDCSGGSGGGGSGGGGGGGGGGGSTNDSNWNPQQSNSHLPTFTSSTNGFQVNDPTAVTTDATDICTRVIFPSSISFWLEWNPIPTQPKGWWHSVSDESDIASSSYVVVDQFLELKSATYVLVGYVPPHPFGGSQPHEGKPYYKVRITARVSSQPNYQTDDIVTFTSNETWIQGLMATAFRVTPTPSNPCQENSLSGFGNENAPTVVVPVMPSQQTSLPTSGSTAQVTVGNTGDLGFIDGGGGSGWSDCSGDGGGGGGSTNDSNWNAAQAVTHAPTFTSTSNGFTGQLPNYQYVYTSPAGIDGSYYLAVTKNSVGGPPEEVNGPYNCSTHSTGYTQPGEFCYYDYRTKNCDGTYYYGTLIANSQLGHSVPFPAFALVQGSGVQCSGVSNQVAETSLSTSGSTAQVTVGNTGDQGFIDGGGGDGWADCDGDGVSSGSSTNDSTWNIAAPNNHAPTFTSTTGGFTVSSDGSGGTGSGGNAVVYAPGNYMVSLRHTVREIRASPATSNGPAYDQITVHGWVSLVSTTEPWKWSVGTTTTPNPSNHWPNATTASPCSSGNGYSGDICTCNLDLIQKYVTYDGLPYNNPYKTTSFTSQKCFSPSIGNSAYKMLTGGVLELKFDLVP